MTLGALSTPEYLQKVKGITGKLGRMVRIAALALTLKGLHTLDIISYRPSVSARYSVVFCAIAHITSASVSDAVAVHPSDQKLLET